MPYLESKASALGFLSAFPDGHWLSYEDFFTDTNVYWLYWRKKGFGKRITRVDGSVTGQAEPITSFYDRLHFEKNRFWDIWTGNPDTEDYWFWQRLNLSEIIYPTFMLARYFSCPPTSLEKFVNALSIGYLYLAATA